MEALNWSNIYRVSHKRRLPTDAEIVALQGMCGRFPDGYVEFIRDFGFGELDCVHILQPDQVSGQRSFLRKLLVEICFLCEDCDVPIYFPPGVVDDAVPLAVADWGDNYFCSPSDPGVLWYMPCDGLTAATLPFGFRNLFVRQVPGEEPEEVGNGPLVFDPDRDVFSREVYVAGPNMIADDSETLATLIRAIHSQLAVTKVVTQYETVSLAYVVRWGGTFITGYRHQDSNYFLYMKVDTEYEKDCDALLAFLAEQGYELETSG